MASLIPNQKKKLAEKLALIDKISDQTNKKYGKVIMGRIGNNKEIMEKLRLKFFPTPSYVYNEAIGGGFARGRLSVITGLRDSGKTGILLETIAHNMKLDPDFTALWLESENSLKKEWIIDTFHIDPERFVLIPLNTQDVGTEATLDIVEGLISTKAFNMVCINSMKCLIPQKEKEKKIGEESVAISARLNSKIARRWTSLVADSEIAFCVVQHMFTDINSYGTPMTISGGEAFKYWASIIAEHTKAGATVTKAASLPQDSKGNPLGAVFNVKITKNHCMPESPYQYSKFSYSVIFGQGIDEIGPSVDRAIEAGILERHGAWLWWMENGKVKEKFASRGAFIEVMKNDEKKWNEFFTALNGTSTELEQLSEEEISAIEKQEKVLSKKIKEEEKLLDSVEKEKVVG